MKEFTQLASAWVEWTSRAGMHGVKVSEDCADCSISFLANDQSFHLRQKNGWWLVDRVDDRGQRHDDIAEFSTFDLAEKYLVWRWASTTRNSIGAEPLGPHFYRQGFSENVTTAPTQNEWLTELSSPMGKAILPQPDSTIFSHVMEKSIEQINHMVRQGIG